ncbi:cysteate synthase [Methanoplanus sp. FWC-SCC4]|uniref:Cysteate synthase n=1 Tax=Methanochimaera problematica TaxID=2609417 RepID=A0AA97FER5_9EURY|nr:cysteate synthase [Methanoplanus sp. FWC-SCC4]WOF16938.1 cysteate synthase [Methanoplanus sp. FWC-SCC4]
MGEYELKCPVCRATVPDHYTNECPEKCSGLILAEYKEKQFIPKGLPGMFRYHNWLPVEGYRDVKTGPATYKSKALAEKLGLKNLYICFNGYWPEKDAWIKTCSFKELEAVPTMLRMEEKGSGILQISSAGNTGRAFCEVSADTGVPVIVVVPKYATESIWTTKPAEDVFLITIDGDYTDAIEFGNKLCQMEGIIPEGGAKNPARRDGMGTTLLSGFEAAGMIPDWYFQAVGSGTGAIAAWEMSKRLVSDGRFKDRLPRLYLSQNIPFIPMVSAWNAKRREIIEDVDMPDAKNSAMSVYATVLTNRHPPYSTKGGLFDALTETNGIMEGIESKRAEEAAEIFEKLEGADTDPAAAVCVASLIDAATKGVVKPDDVILLNITGGGYKRADLDFEKIIVEPKVSLPAGSDTGVIKDELVKWMSNYA